MPLNQENRLAIAKAIEAKGISSQCLLCKTPGMLVLDYLGGLLLSDETAAAFTIGPIVKTALMKCSNCGNTEMFELAILGLTLK